MNSERNEQLRTAYNAETMRTRVRGVDDSGMTLDEALAVVRQHAIAWGQDDGKTFDKAYDHRWHRDENGDRQCRDCLMFDVYDMGYPCTAKAEPLNLWLPRRAPAVSPEEPT